MLTISRQVTRYLVATLDIGFNPETSISHRAAACSALSGIIERCTASREPAVRDVLWKSELNVWRGAIFIIIERCNSARVKSLRQLLLAVTDALLQCSNAEKQDAVRSDMLEILYPIVFSRVDHAQAKPALQILAHFIAKGFISLDKFWPSAALWLANGSGVADEFLDSRTLVLRALFEWIASLDTAPAAGNLINIILKTMHSDRDGNVAKAEPIWMIPLLSAMAGHPQETRAFREHVFPGIFGLNIEDFKTFLVHLGLELLAPHKRSTHSRVESDELGFDQESVPDPILFHALQTGKDLGIILEVGKS